MLEEGLLRVSESSCPCTTAVLPSPAAEPFGGSVGVSASHPVNIPPPHFPEIPLVPPASRGSITSLSLRRQFFSVELAGVELQQCLNRRQEPRTLNAKKPQPTD